MLIRLVSIMIAILLLSSCVFKPVTKIYTNEGLGIEVEYPATWELTEETAENFTLQYIEDHYPEASIYFHIDELDPIETHNVTEILQEQNDVWLAQHGEDTFEILQVPEPSTHYGSSMAISTGLVNIPLLVGGMPDSLVLPYIFYQETRAILSPNNNRVALIVVRYRGGSPESHYSKDIGLVLESFRIE